MAHCTLFQCTSLLADAETAKQVQAEGTAKSEKYFGIADEDEPLNSAPPSEDTAPATASTAGSKLPIISAAFRVGTSSCPSAVAADTSGWSIASEVLLLPYYRFGANPDSARHRAICNFTALCSY